MAVTPDLDARVAEWADLLDAGALGALIGTELNKQSCIELAALIRDLHAALKAARGEGEELVLWLMRNEHGEPCHAAVNEHEAWANYEPDEVDEVIADGYTVRRVLCRIAPDDGGEG